MTKIIFLSVTVIHGLIHLMGFVKAFDLAPVEQLSREISRSAGLFWLLTALLFLATAILYILKSDIWWVVSAAAVIVSQVLIMGSWSDARFGTIANLILIAFIVAAYISQLPDSQGDLF